MSEPHPDLDQLLGELDEPTVEVAEPIEPSPVAAVPGDPEDDDPEDDDAEDLVALAGAASSRFADEAAAIAAVAAADDRRRAAAAGVRDVPRRRLRSEADDGGTGSLLQYPSAVFPAPPVFRLRVPSGWVAVPLPDAELAVRRPEPVDGFLANVIVRVRRIAATPTVHDDLRAVVAIDDPPADLEVLADHVVADVTTPVRRLAVRFPGPGGQLLRARYLLVYVPATEHLANVVTAVATWPASAPTEVATEMDAVVRSLRLFTPRPA